MEELIEAGWTIGLAILLPKDSLRQLRQAESTDKVLRMELVAHGTDAAAGDGLPTPIAEGSLAVMVMELAEWTSIQFKEGASGESAEAVLGVNRRKRKGRQMSRIKHQQSKTFSLEIPASYLCQ